MHLLLDEVGLCFLHFDHRQHHRPGISDCGADRCGDAQQRDEQHPPDSVRANLPAVAHHHSGRQFLRTLLQRISGYLSGSDCLCGLRPGFQDGGGGPADAGGAGAKHPPDQPGRGDFHHPLLRQSRFLVGKPAVASGGPRSKAARQSRNAGSAKSRPD